MVRFRPSNPVAAGVAILVACACAQAAAPTSYKFNFTSTPRTGYVSITPKSVFNTVNGFGWDFGSDTSVVWTAAMDGIEGRKSPANPYNWTGDPFYQPARDAFFFSAKVPAGNYELKITLGSKDTAVRATLRTEQRRLTIEDWKIAAGTSETRVVHVNRRSDTIPGTKTLIGLTSREQSYIDLDDRLSIEFNGDHPVVQTLEIAPVDTDITVWLCGHSTVVDQPQEPWGTWGMNFPRFFKAGVTISDQAESGLTSGSFISQRRLDNIAGALKTGDYVFVEFGHNDMKSTSATKMDDFKTNLLKFVSTVKAKGATPVLVSPTARLSFSGTTPVNTLESYPDSMKAVAAEQGIPLMDLNGFSTAFIKALGPTNAYRAYTHFPANTVPGQTAALADNTHWNDYGGYELARAMATEVKRQNFAFAKFLSDDYSAFDPTKPDAYATFALPFSPFLDTTFNPPDSAVTTMLSREEWSKSPLRIASARFRNGTLALRVRSGEPGLEVRVVDADGTLEGRGFLGSDPDQPTVVSSFHGWSNRVHLVEVVREGVIQDRVSVVP